MKMPKILININNLNEIEEYKKIGITNFLFALEGFSIGYNTFQLDSIPDDAYILLNRVMDTDTMNGLRKIKNDLKRFKGIIFEDVGVYSLLKDSGISLIWHQVHFAVSSSSINFWLSKVDSCVLSNEITKEEIKEIVSKVNKPIIINVLGKNNIMYSRRTLLTNFNKYNNLGEYNDMRLVEPITHNEFLAKESKYGTYFLNNEYFNYINKLDINEDNVLFYLIYNQDLSVSKIKEILDGAEFGDDGFLNKKTVYQLKDYKDREAR